MFMLQAGTFKFKNSLLPIFFFQKYHYKPVALKTLARDVLGRAIQEDEHDSIEDAKACMDIYLKVALEWDSIYKKRPIGCVKQS